MRLNATAILRIGVIAYSLHGCVKSNSPTQGMLPPPEVFPLSLKTDTLNDLFLVSDSNRNSIAGFNSYGRLISSDMLNAPWLSPQSLVTLVAQNSAVIQFSREVEGLSESQLQIQVDSGLKVFEDCAGLVIFSMVNGKSDCFDPSLSSQSNNVSYDISEQEDWGYRGDDDDPNSLDIPITYAVKITNAAQGKNFQQFRRKPDGTFTQTLQYNSQPDEVYIGQSKDSLYFKVNKTTDSDLSIPPLWFAYLFDNKLKTAKRVDLDASQILGFKRVIYYISKDRKKVMIAGADNSSSPTIDDVYCTMSVDSQNNPFNQDENIFYAGYSNEIHSFANFKGQVLRASYLRPCLVINVPVSNNLVSARLQGDLFIYKEQSRGLTLQLNFNLVSISILSEYEVLEFRIRKDQRSILFIGKDKEGTLVGGLVDALGDQRIVAPISLDHLKLNGYH